MATNLYIATETLLKAYRRIMNENSISTLKIGDYDLKTGIPDRMEFYRQSFNAKELTISEKMLDYVRQDEGVFSTKQSAAIIKNEQQDKDNKAVDYILGSLADSLPDDVFDGIGLTKDDLRNARLLRSLEDEDEFGDDVQVEYIDPPLNKEVSDLGLLDSSRNLNPLEPKGSGDNE